jgi:formylglycine-generating enzyme required for sulfatase activity
MLWLILQVEAAPLRWMAVPLGVSPIGSNLGTEHWQQDEKPSWWMQLVTPYEVLVTEVTNSQFEAWDKNHMRYNNCQDADCPVVNVSWFQARDFCRWAGGDLPTEVEWEYAARAGSTGLYWWGENSAIEHAWYTENSGREPREVGAAGHANPWGLVDMLGNVWEWVLDAYQSDVYRKFSANDKKNPRVWSLLGLDVGEVGSSSLRVGRGGSSWSTLEELRVSNRIRGAAGSFSRNQGFRCVRAL